MLIAEVIKLTGTKKTRMPPVICRRISSRLMLLGSWSTCAVEIRATATTDSVESRHWFSSTAPSPDLAARQDLPTASQSSFSPNSKADQHASSSIEVTEGFQTCAACSDLARSFRQRLEIEDRMQLQALKFLPDHIADVLHKLTARRAMPFIF